MCLGSAAQHARRLLAHGVGVGLAQHRDADALRGEGPREVRPLLALRHAPRLLRRHRRHRAQRVPVSYRSLPLALALIYTLPTILLNYISYCFGGCSKSP